jgi:shikimate dehydrogenase
MDFIKACVIGYPVKKSKSPMIFNYWIDKYGLDGEFGYLEIEPERLESEIVRLTQEDYTGFCVTIPHKQRVMGLCFEVDEIAQKIGATNSVSIRDGKLYATNTDMFGFIQNIKDTHPEFSFKGIKAVVLGAGGASRAIICGLADEGVSEIIITNRTREKAEEVAKIAPDITRVVDWEERNDALDGAGLLVNSTSLGMEGQPRLDISLNKLPVQAIVSDIVYYPLETELLRQARERGNKVVTGIGMLLQQARPSFKNWFGVDPEIDDKLIEMVLE